MSFFTLKTTPGCPLIKDAHHFAEAVSFLPLFLFAVIGSARVSPALHKLGGRLFGPAGFHRHTLGVSSSVSRHAEGGLFDRILRRRSLGDSATETYLFQYDGLRQADVAKHGTRYLASHTTELCILFYATPRSPRRLQAP